MVFSFSLFLSLFFYRENDRRFDPPRIILRGEKFYDHAGTFLRTLPSKLFSFYNVCAIELCRAPILRAGTSAAARSRDLTSIAGALRSTVRGTRAFLLFAYHVFPRALLTRGIIMHNPKGRTSAMVQSSLRSVRPPS